MTTRRQAALDPAKRVAKFATDHIAHVDHPGNGKDYLLIQDSYTSSLTGAVGTLARLLGPLVQYTTQEAYDALNQCYQHMQGQQEQDSPMASVPRLYSALSDEDKAALEAGYEYDYPEQNEITEAIEHLGDVPDDAEVYEPAQTLTHLLSAYTPDAWPLSGDYVYCSTNALKAPITDHVVRSATQGVDVRGFASMLQTLQPGKGLLVARNTALWPLVVREGAADDQPTDQPVQPVADPAPADAPTIQAAAQEEIVPADNYIRSIMGVADPVVAALDAGVSLETQPQTIQPTQAQRVEPVGVAPTGGSPAAVNQGGSLDGVLSDMDMDQVRQMLANPALTEVQRQGIVRAFVERVQGELLQPQAQPTGGIDLATMRSMIAEAVQQAVSPVAEKLTQIEQRIDGQPVRRSLVTQPARDPEQALPASQQRFTLRSVQELAQYGTTVSL